MRDLAELNKIASVNGGVKLGKTPKMVIDPEVERLVNSKWTNELKDNCKKINIDQDKIVEK